MRGFNTKPLAESDQGQKVCREPDVSVTRDGHHLTIGFGTEAIVGGMVDVFRDETHCTVTQEELSTAGVTGAEAEFIDPVVDPVAAGGGGRVTGVQIDWVERGSHSLAVVGLQPALSYVVAAFRANFADVNCVAEPVGAVSHGVAAIIAMEGAGDAVSRSCSDYEIQVFVGAGRRSVRIAAGWTAGVGCTFAACIVLDGCAAVVVVTSGIRRTDVAGHKEDLPHQSAIRQDRSIDIQAWGRGIVEWNLIEHVCLLDIREQMCKQAALLVGASGVCGVPERSGWESVVGVVVVMECNSDLFKIVFALSSAGGFTSLLDGRQQQGHQNCDDCNHHKQFDERKRVPERGTSQAVHEEWSCSTWWNVRDDAEKHNRVWYRPRCPEVNPTGLSASSPGDTSAAGYPRSADLKSQRAEAIGCNFHPAAAVRLGKKSDQSVVRSSAGNTGKTQEFFAKVHGT